MNRFNGITCALCVLAACFALAVSPAFADEPSSSSSASTVVVETVDYSEVISSIDGKLDGLAKSEDVQRIAEALEGKATSDDVNALREAVKVLSPVDNSKRIEMLNEILSNLSTVSVITWVTLLLLLGTVLALVFLVSYRSHT